MTSTSYFLIPNPVQLCHRLLYYRSNSQQPSLPLPKRPILPIFGVSRSIRQTGKQASNNRTLLNHSSHSTHIVPPSTLHPRPPTNPAIQRTKESSCFTSTSPMNRQQQSYTSRSHLYGASSPPPGDPGRPTLTHRTSRNRDRNRGRGLKATVMDACSPRAWYDFTVGTVHGLGVRYRRASRKQKVSGRRSVISVGSRIPNQRIRRND